MKKLIAEIIFGEESILVSGNLLHASFGSLDRGDLNELSEYGIYANKGNLSFIDIDSSFKALYKKYESTTVGKVRFWIGYNINCVATFDIETAHIDEEKNAVDIDLISHLVSWQNKKIHRSLFRQYNMLFFKKSLLDLLDFAKEHFGVEIKIKTDRLGCTVVNCPDIEDHPTVWDFMTEICQAGMCMIFDDEYGVPCICDTTPNNSNIVVNPNKIIGIGEYSISSVPNAKISVTKRTKQKAKPTDSETKTIYLYDGDGNVVSYEQDLLTFDEWSDIREQHNVLIRYGVNFENPTFSVDGIICRGDRGYKDLSSIDEDIAVRLRSEDISLSIFSNSAIVEAEISPSKYSPEAGFDPYMWFRKVRISLLTTHYRDEEAQEKSYTTTKLGQQKTLSTNKFIQTESTYAGKSLADNILETTKTRYANPIKCFTMDCLTGEYYGVNGEIALPDGELFKKYDTIIPYVIRNGKKQPYSKDENGKPSTYEIVGIEYEYNGIFKQKLYLQENRGNIQYDFIKPKSLSYNTTSETTRFFWNFTDLVPYKKYTISWSMNELVLSDQLEMYKDYSGNFCYFTYNNGNISTYPVSKDFRDVLNYTVDIEASATGNIAVGFLCINDFSASDFYDVWSIFVEDNTNHILSFEKQS